MKSPGRLLHDVGLFEFMAKLWLALLIALLALAFDPWRVLISVTVLGAYALSVLVVAVIGGKLFVSLFQLARRERKPNRSAKPLVV